MRSGSCHAPPEQEGYTTPTTACRSYFRGHLNERDLKALLGEDPTLFNKNLCELVHLWVHGDGLSPRLEPGGLESYAPLFTFMNEHCSDSPNSFEILAEYFKEHFKKASIVSNFKLVKVTQEMKKHSIPGDALIAWENSAREQYFMSMFDAITLKKRYEHSRDVAIITFSDNLDSFINGDIILYEGGRTQDILPKAWLHTTTHASQFLTGMNALIEQLSEQFCQPTYHAQALRDKCMEAIGLIEAKRISTPESLKSTLTAITRSTLAAVSLTDNHSKIKDYLKLLGEMHKEINTNFPEQAATELVGMLLDKVTSGTIPLAAVNEIFTLPVVQSLVNSANKDQLAERIHAAIAAQDEPDENFSSLLSTLRHMKDAVATTSDETMDSSYKQAHEKYQALELRDRINTSNNTIDRLKQHCHDHFSIVKSSMFGIYRHGLKSPDNDTYLSHTAHSVLLKLRTIEPLRDLSADEVSSTLRVLEECNSILQDKIEQKDERTDEYKALNRTINVAKNELRTSASLTQSERTSRRPTSR